MGWVGGWVVYVFLKNPDGHMTLENGITNVFLPSRILFRVVSQNLERAYHDFQCQSTNVSALPSDPPPPAHPASASHRSQGLSGKVSFFLGSGSCLLLWC